MMKKYQNLNIRDKFSETKTDCNLPYSDQAMAGWQTNPFYYCIDCAL